MNIYVVRHGQTNLNKAGLMQGRYDEPLNDVGRAQALEKSKLLKGIKFDAVYSSPLSRAKETAQILSGLSDDEIIKDERIIEVDFGKYERVKYNRQDLNMILYWVYPEIFKCPKTVEDTKSMIKRSRDFLIELENKDYENVLVVCHGGIIRTLTGYLEDRKNGLKWRPRPKNTEIRVYESINGKHKYLKSL